jgi:hypothetical protein
LHESSDCSRSFQEVWESLQDDLTGRPVSARSSDNAENIRVTELQDRRITTRQFAEHLGVGKEAAQANFGKTFAEKEDLFEADAARINGRTERASG